MTITQTDFGYICELLREHSGIVLEPGKEYLAEERLCALVQRERLPSVTALVAQLRHHRFGALHKKVIAAMTTHETSFFRDQHPFEALRTHVLPALIESRKKQRRLEIWSAACSSGQEAYSIAMCLRESFPDLAKWAVRIHATDLAEDMVARTTAGKYTAMEIGRGLPGALLGKYFDPAGPGEWQVRTALRGMVQARAHNLLGAWSFAEPFDLVFMRNVLIYFDQETKQKILRRVQGQLRPGGWLCLGASETTPGLERPWRAVRAGRSTFYLLDISSP